MYKQIKRGSFQFLLMALLVNFTGCGDIENTDSNVVGNNFVSAEVIDDINTSVMLNVVKSAIDSTATNAFGYKAVKINYKTEDQSGKSVTASGLLVIPTASDAYQAYLASVGKAFSVSMICDNHGTIFTDAEAPSNVEVFNGMPDYSLAVLMTGYAGFASVLPDYIGYGTSNAENHPYMLKKASAKASLDMIRASQRYMTDNNIVFNGQLYISGYSQGGHTAMALAEDIETNHNNEFTLKGVAPMAGPHDLEALGDIELDASHTMMYPAFLGYLADSYSQAYSNIDLSDVVNETNTTMYHSLFDGSKTNVEIHAALGLTINYGFGVYTADTLFKTSLIDDYQNSLNAGLALREKFVENSTYDWVPQTKMNLIHCVDDEIIPFSMSQNAYDNFLLNGANFTDMTLTPIPTSAITVTTFVHAGCANTAYGAAVTWFNAIRNGDI
jgi:hypothetical protein